MGDRRALRAAPVLLAGGWLLALFAPLLASFSGVRALANRDIALFHLPLRTSFRTLLSEGAWPAWNPWLHGGQPVLSNPNYAAFYPPTWLALALPPAAGLALLVLLHAAVAAAGAWFLARRLGCGRPAAALALVAAVGGGAYLSLLSSFTSFCGMSWLPWVLAWGDAALRAPGRSGGGDGWLRPALLAGGGLALIVLAGEPVSVLIAGLGLLALAADAALAGGGGVGARPLPGLRAGGRIGVVVAFALLLAAVQLLPTGLRLADSPRSGGLAAEQATLWSAPPARLVELVLPRFFGDPAREERHFGWRLHDHGYPYLPSLYPGLLVTVLGVTALLRRGTARRVAWGSAAALGVLLALGRHDPLYEALRTLPPLSLVRYPEKFAGLALAALVFAAACGWQRLLEERRAGRHGAADLPLALALVVLATALGLGGLLAARPELGSWFVRTYGSPLAGAAEVARGAAGLAAEAWAAAATAAATALLFGLCRLRRVPEGTLAVLAVALLAGDLWHYGHGLVQTVPAAVYRELPPLAAAARRTGARVFLQRPADDTPEVFPRRGGVVAGRVRAQLARLEPYSGLLWGVGHALHEDYDLLLTGPARQALDLLHAEEVRPDLARRLLGAWNVGTVLERRPPGAWLAEAASGAAGNAPRPVTAVPNPYLLPRLRFVPRVHFHANLPSAIGGARAAYYALHIAEHVVAEDRPGTVEYPAPPVPLGLKERGGRIELHYRGAAPAFLTVAETFDPGWQAEVDGEDVRVYRTAVGQMGLELPAGEHRLVLAYRDRSVTLGAAVSLLTLAVGAVVLRRSR